MAKIPHIIPLPTDLTPARSSADMLKFFVQRLLDGGEQQKVVAHSLGFGPNNISNLKNGTSPIPLSRVMMLAEALRLSEAERFEFMTTRLIELHGEKSELCFSTVAAWAEEVFAPTGAEAALVAMWRRAAAPAPHLVADLLDDPTVAGEISDAIERAAQRRFLQLEEEAKAA